MLPRDLERYGSSLLAASVSLANVFFWTTGSSYFAPETDEMPLLHTWSLSVEEQFYILWPALLLLGMRWFRPRTLLWVTVGGTVLALGFSEFAVRRMPAAAFYLLPSRAFEMLIGGALALAWEHIHR